MIINDPAILAEVTAVFEAYQAALVANDTAVLDKLFWNSPHVLRYGVGEALYGRDEILAFRTSRPGRLPPRTEIRRSITTFGQDYATTNVEFLQEGTEKPGRQSQCWVRMPDGWRVTAAHVSFQK